MRWIFIITGLLIITFFFVTVPSKKFTDGGDFSIVFLFFMALVGAVIIVTIKEKIDQIKSRNNNHKN